MTTISRLAYQIVADTAGFTKGVTLTRNELALTKQVMRDSISPTQAYAGEIQALDRVLAKGAISQQQYAEAVGKVKAQFYGDLGGKIRGVGLAMGATAGAVTAGLTLMGKGMLDAYAGQQDAEAKLRAAMTANGTAAAGTLARYQAFASEMQRVTTTGDEAALGMLQVAESLGVTGQAAERAVRNAIGMGTALGLDAQSAMKMTTALEQGNTTLLTRYLPSLRQIEDPAKRAAAAQEMLGRMFGTAEAAAQTYTGSAQQLTNALGDVQESFGQVLAEAITPLIRGTLSTVQAFGSLSESTRSTIVYTGLVAAGLGTVVTAAGGAVAIAGQLTIAYGALQTSAVGARIAQLSLNTAIGAGYVAAVGAALVVGYQLGKMLVDQTQWAQDAAKAYEEYAAGVKSLQSREAKQREDTLAAIQGGPPQQRQARLQAEMAMAQKQLEGLTTRAEMAKREMDRLQPSWLSLGQAGKKIWEAQAAEYEALKMRAAEAGNWINTLESEMRKGAQTAPLTPAVATPAGPAGMAAGSADAGKTLRQETDELVDSLQQQMQEVGKTADQVALLRLEARGLGPEWLRVIAVMQSDLAAARQAADMQANVDQLTASLREQIATAGMSADQVERWKLANAGATVAQLGQVAALQQQAAAAREQQAAQQAAVDAQKSLRDNLSQTTAALREQIATAGMNADEITRWKLAQKGATPEQLAAIAALQRQAKGLQDVSRETRVAKSETGGWTAATRGSSEALDRIDAYRRMLAASSRKGERGGVSPPVPSLPAPGVPPIAAGIQPTWAQTPAPPMVPPIAAGIQPTWAQTPAPPMVPPIAAGIQPAWSQVPAPPVVTPIAADIQPTWQPRPAAPEMPPVPAEIQTAWADILQPPTPPAIAADIQPTWQPPPAPVLPPVPAQIQTAWGDIVGQPPIPPGPGNLVGPPIVNEGPPRRSAREAAAEPPGGESPNVLLGKVVELLQRIATASEDDKITVEQTA